MNKLTISIAAASMAVSSIAQAVPWCHRGTIVQIADVTWSQSQIMANFTGSIPGSVTDPEHYVTFTATHNYASGFVGGGGGFGGYSVPGSGEVIVVPYAPNSYINVVGPGAYFTSQGVSFKMRKCYTVAPLTAQLEKARLNPRDPLGGIVTVPLEGLDAMSIYWDIVDPDEDADFDSSMR